MEKQTVELHTNEIYFSIVNGTQILFRFSSLLPSGEHLLAMEWVRSGELNKGAFLFHIGQFDELRPCTVEEKHYFNSFDPNYQLKAIINSKYPDLVSNWGESAELLSFNQVIELMKIAQNQRAILTDDIIARGAIAYLDSVGNVDRKDVIYHDFTQGANWYKLEISKL